MHASLDDCSGDRCSAARPVKKARIAAPSKSKKPPAVYAPPVSPSAADAPSDTDASSGMDSAIVVSDDDSSSLESDLHQFDEVVVLGDGRCMFYAVAGRVGATYKDRMAVVRDLKARIYAYVATHWNSVIPREWCCGSDTTVVLGDFLNVSLSEYRRTLMRSSFQTGCLEWVGVGSMEQTDE